MRKQESLIAVLFLLSIALAKPVLSNEAENVHATLIPGSGTYSRKISTQNPLAQAFFRPRDCVSPGVFTFLSRSPLTKKPRA